MTAIVSRLTILTCLTLVAAPGSTDDGVIPLTKAHAHNDYEHKRPLFDALDRGFCSVEADVFLVHGELLVAHSRSQINPERTLEKLYLAPLRERVHANGGRVFKNGPTIFLLIDVKTDAKSTHAAVAKLLAKYDDIFSVTKDGRFEARAVTAVISGNRDRSGMAAEKIRYAGLDGRPADLDSKEPADFLPWISESWTTMFKWRGQGQLPESERQKLEAFVKKAHAAGRLVRFWATPETTECWQALRSAGVDLLNTDKLDELKDFLLRSLGD